MRVDAATLSPQSADVFADKIASIRDQGGRVGTQRTRLTEDEFNSWFLYRGQTLLPPGVAQPQVTTWISSPWNSVMLFLLCGTLAWHSSLGVQVVIEDYVHGPLLKVSLLLLNQFAHVFVAIAAVFAVLRISLGNAL